MKFTDIYNNSKFRYSIEVYPPKTSLGVENLIKVLKTLESISPAYISITYGAMGSTQDYTKDLAFRIYDQIKSHTAFHFTCVGTNKEDIKKYVKILYDKGIDFVLALRGDQQPDQKDFTETDGGLGYANELVSYLKGLHNFSIAVAAYPEKHLEAKTLEADIDNLKRKIDAGAELIITQLFFKNPIFFDWLSKIRQKGISVPVIPGIMPILKLDQIQKITGMCGASLPESLMRELEKCGGDENAMREVGVGHAIQQCRELIENKISGIHFFCLNKSYSVLKITQACQDLLV